MWNADNDQLQKLNKKCYYSTNNYKSTFFHLKRLINPLRVQVWIGFRFYENKYSNSIFKANTEGLHEKAERLISNLFLHLSERKKRYQSQFCNIAKKSI